MTSSSCHRPICHPDDVRPSIRQRRAASGLVRKDKGNQHLQSVKFGRAQEEQLRKNSQIIPIQAPKKDKEKKTHEEPPFFFPN